MLTGDMSVNEAKEKLRKKIKKLKSVLKTLEEMTESDSQSEEAETDGLSDGSNGVKKTAKAILLDILKENSGKPMHGTRELYPEMVNRGGKLRKEALGTTLSRIKNIEKVEEAPNTWIYNG